MSATVSDSQSASNSPRCDRSRRLCLTTLAIIAVVLLGLGYEVANWEWAAGAAEGTHFSGPPALTALPERFRVATFNIHGGFGLDRRLDLRRTAEVLKGFDFVGLNEVRGPGWQDPRNQAEQLGELLGLGWLFAPTEETWSGPHFGQGVLSRLPVSSWKRVPFDRANGNGFRNYVECQIPVGAPDLGAQLTILVTHLDRKTDRQNQLRVIIRKFLEVPAPAILMGDLNAKITEPQLIQLAQEPGVIDCFGQFSKGDFTQKRIDWVFIRGLKCRQSHLVPNSASDHPAGWAEVELLHRSSSP
ncbi:MAG: endonuclease/exonuclease/phosphatase family protein [Planctomycetota bacterium]